MTEKKDPNSTSARQKERESSARPSKKPWHQPRVSRLSIDQTLGGVIPERGEDETYFGIPIGTRF